MSIATGRKNIVANFGFVGNTSVIGSVRQAASAASQDARVATKKAQDFQNTAIPRISRGQWMGAGADVAAQHYQEKQLYKKAVAAHDLAAKLHGQASETTTGVVSEQHASKSKTHQQIGDFLAFKRLPETARAKEFASRMDE